MDFEFRDKDLEQLYTDPDFSAGFSKEIVKAFRKRIQQIDSATDQRDLRAFKSLHLEKLKGKRQHQHSLRLNDQRRLILEIEKTDTGEKIVVVAIEDYHGKKK